MRLTDATVPSPVQVAARSAHRADTTAALPLLLLAGALGLLCGFIEVAMRLAGRLLLDKTVHLDPNLIWIAPVADLLLFVTAAGLTVAIMSRRMRRYRAVAVLAVSVVLLIVTVLYSYPRIHRVAALVLAIGIAVQVTRLANPWLTRILPWARSSFIVFAGSTLLLAISVIGARALGERRTLATLPGAARSAPNVVLFILDTVRAANLSVYGYERATTPNLQQLAQHAARFEHAFTTAPWTLPSHGSIFTGRYPHELSTDWEQSLDHTYPTIAEVLRERGYRTIGINANYLYGGPEFGLGRGFIHYEAYPINVGQLLASSRLIRLAIGLGNRAFGTYWMPARRNAEEVTRTALRWIDKDDRPFFLFVNYFDAHEPYAPPAPYDLMFTRGRPGIRHVRTGERHSAGDIRDLRDSYDGAIAYVDDQIGRFLRELERMGLRENTVIIVTSDHGEEFGEHGYMSHGNGLHLQSLHVPLLISQAGRVPTTSISAPVTLRDLPATMLALTGIRAPQIPGTSLTRYWNSEAAGQMESPILSELDEVANQPAWYPIAGGAMRSIVVGHHHYIRRVDTEELYDIMRDPAERIDLTTASGNAALLNAMRVALLRATNGSL